MIGPFSDDQIRKVARAVKPKKIIPIEQGMSSFTYRLEADKGVFYLSTPNSQLKHKAYAPKAAIFKKLEDAGVATPYVVDSKDFDPDLDRYSWMIATEVKGKPVGDNPGSVSEEVFIHAGADLARIHSIKVSGWGYINGFDEAKEPWGSRESYFDHIGNEVRYEDEFVNKLDYILTKKVIDDTESERIRDLVEREAEGFEGYDPILMHGDYHGEHIFIDQGKYAGVIDWDGMAAGLPYYDLQQFSVYHADEEFDLLMKGYAQVSRIEDRDKFERLLKFDRVVYCVGKIAKGMQVDGYDA